jgi:ATP-dependent Clp protease ATP-binding subunit ClpB
MNADKFTQKTIETIQTAQSMAQENGNQYLTPEHLLYALVDADGGLIGTLLGRMGVDCNAVLSELDTAIDQLPTPVLFFFGQRIDMSFFQHTHV